MKNTYYFAHDYNARTDTKMQELLMTFGVAGIGIYWCVIEQLYEQGGRLPLTAVRSMAFALHVDDDTVRSVVCDFGLFDNDGTEFWSESASRRIEKMESVRRRRQEATSAAMRRRWEKTKERAETEDMSHTGNVTTEDISHICNIDDEDISHITIKENKRKEKKIKENNDNTMDTPKSSSQFKKPTVAEVAEYCSKMGYTWSAEAFFDFYESKGWKVGRNPMRDWKAAVRNWERGERERKQRKDNYGNISNQQKRGEMDIRLGRNMPDGGYKTTI